MRLTERIAFAGLGFLTIWTMGVHLATFSGLEFQALRVAGGLACLGGAAMALRPPDLFRSDLLALPQMRFRPISPSWLEIAVFAGLAAAFLAAAAWQWKTSDIRPLWALCLALGLIGLSVPGRLHSLFFLRAGAPPPGRDATGGTFLLCATGLAGFYLFTSIPDSDDSLLLNLARGARDAEGAIYVFDTMLGLPDLAFPKSTYRLESYPLLAALISDFAGVTILTAAHAVLPILVCIWAAAILTLVHRMLFPGHFPVTLFIHMVVLLALDGALTSYGYHAVPRFFHGKGPFLAVVVPLLATLTLLVLRSGSRSALAALAAAIVTALGLTANALYAAPLVSALFGATWLIVGGAARLRAFALIAAVVYPAVLAAWLIAFDPPGASEIATAGIAGGVLWGLMGSPPAMFLALVLLFTGAVAVLFHPAMRAVSLYVLIFLLFVFNPFLWDAYGRFVTGNLNYRLLWAVPVPLVLAVVAGLFWANGNPIFRLCVLVLLGVGLIGPGSILHRTEFGLSIRKVPPVFDVAAALTEAAGPGDLVLAPERLSAWIPVQEHAPAVVESRVAYVMQRQDPRHSETLETRAKLYLHWDSPEGTGLTASDTMSLIFATGTNLIALDDRRAHHAALLGPLAAADFTELEGHGSWRFFSGGRR